MKFFAFVQGGKHGGKTPSAMDASDLGGESENGSLVEQSVNAWVFKNFGLDS